MAELSSEEKYRLGIINREQRELDMMREEHKKNKSKIDPVELAMGGTDGAKKVIQEGVDIANKQQKIVQQEKLERERQRQADQKQYSSTVDKIINNAKSQYDEKMNAYMSMNLFGKAKTMFKGKKPKSMTGKEIMSAYGQKAAQEELEKTLEIARKEFEEDIKSTKEHYKEQHPDSEDYSAIEDIIKSKERMYQVKIEKIKREYAEMLQLANELVVEGYKKL